MGRWTKTTQIFMFNNGPWGFQNFNTPFTPDFTIRFGTVGDGEIL